MSENKSQFENVAVVKKANVFNGKCISHTVLFADESRKTVGVILPATLTFNTRAPEIMETVSGGCRYRIADGEWIAVGEGQSFNVPADSKFEIEVSGEPYHYVCHFG